MTGRKVLGILLIVAAFVVMFTIPWGIMAFGPFWAFSIFLFLILGAAGGVLMACGSGKAPVEKPVSRSRWRNPRRETRGSNLWTGEGSVPDTARTAVRRSRTGTCSAASAGGGSDGSRPYEQGADRRLPRIHRLDGHRFRPGIPLHGPLPLLPGYFRAWYDQRIGRGVASRRRDLSGVRLAYVSRRFILPGVWKTSVRRRTTHPRSRPPGPRRVPRCRRCVRRGCIRTES